MQQVIQTGNQLATNMLDVHEIIIPQGMFGLAGLMQPQLDVYEPEKFFIHQAGDVDFFKRDKETYAAIDGEWEIKLDRRNNVVGQLALGVDPEDLKHSFLGGRYFVVDDQIVDYRLAENIGKFMHDDKGLMNLVKQVGMTIDHHGVIKARSVTGKMDYSAGDKEGLQFAIDIGFEWSPFSLDIDSMLSLLRLACYNGLVVSDPVVSHKIPVMNGWEENLRIANDVLRHSFDHKVGPRLSKLQDETINMHDTMGLCDLIASALGDKKEGTIINHNEVVRIHELLEPIVTPEVRGMQKNLLKFIGAPITAFDAMNVATELSTHYINPFSPAAKKLAGFANNLLFSELRQSNLAVNLDNLVMDTKVFQNTDMAFFGTTCH